MRFLVAGLTCSVFTAGLGLAQSVISAHSGVVQYVEGRAFIDGQPVQLKVGHFPDIKANQEFRTEDGRAEILLTPGVFLRLGEDSAIRMLSNSLEDTRVEVTAGSAIAEVDQIPKDNSITLVYKDDSVSLLKHGLYRVDATPARLQVYDGEATVTNASGKLTVKGGKETVLDGALAAESFDKNTGDELYRWADRRAGYVSQANVASASVLSVGSGYGGFDYGYGPGFGYGSGLGYGPGLGLGYGGYMDPGALGGWQFNPLFGMYSWVPIAGMGYSPFGYSLFSPATVAYAPAFARSFNGRSAPVGLRSSASSFGGARAAAISSRSGGSLGGGGFSGAHAGGGFSGGGHAGGGGGGHAGR